MATTVKIRRSGTATATPSALEHGEIAINYADGKVFWKNASDVITSFTFQSYALASHTHAASDITSGTLDAARLPLATTGAAGAVIVGTGLGVSTGTVSVTYGTTAGTACQGNDSRLSDTRTPTDGSVTTAKLADDSVTYAKLQNVSATSRILGRSSSGAGDVEELDAATARTVLSVQPTASPTFTGTLTAAACSFTGAVAVTSPVRISGTVAGNARMLEWQTEGTLRWRISPHFNAETGSNIGSDLYITRFNDAGNFAGTPLQIRRDNGLVTVESNLTVQGTQVQVPGGSASAPGVARGSDTDSGVYWPAANQVALSTDSTERMLIDASGNIRINGAAAATSAVGAIHIKNGTAPSASITDGVVLFAADVSSSSELRVRDETGNVTTLSPHAFPLIPDGPSEPMAWAYYSERDGRRINVDMLRVVRLLEQLTGEKLVYED